MAVARAKVLKLDLFLFMSHPRLRRDLPDYVKQLLSTMGNDLWTPTSSQLIASESVVDQRYRPRATPPPMIQVS